MTLFSSSGSVNISFVIEKRFTKSPRTDETGEDDRALGGTAGGGVDFTGERRRRFIGFGGTGGAKKKNDERFDFVFSLNVLRLHKDKVVGFGIDGRLFLHADETVNCFSKWFFND